MKLNRVFFLLVFPAIVCIPDSGISQTILHGPTCVTTGLQYDYFVEGDAGSADSAAICITGGKFTDSMDSCKDVKMHSKISITWNNNFHEGRMIVKSKNDKTVHPIEIVSPLNGGKIEDLKKTQSVSYDTIPLSLDCTPASGGSCSPEYGYQWQESPDQINWTGMQGQTSQSFSFTKVLKEATFFRRKVTDKTSGSVSYSDVASVFIDIE